MMRVLPALAALLLVVGAAPPAAAIWHDVSADTTQTFTLLRQNWDAFNFTIPANWTVHVEVTANASIDFYVFTFIQFQQYVTPGLSGFAYELREENARDFVVDLAANGRIVLVDNTNFSRTGADPVLRVNYTIAATYRAPAPSPNPWGFVLLGGAGVVAAVSLVYVLWRARRAPPPPQPRSPPT